MMKWFLKHQEPVEEVQVKQEWLYVPPVDTSYCACGCETTLCRHCYRVYCPVCHVHHVLDVPPYGLQWVCDFLEDSDCGTGL